MAFYDIYGKEVSVEIILQSMIDGYTGDATDFEDGSQIKNLFTAFAILGYDIKDMVNDVLTQTNVDTADGEYLDTIAEQPSINLSRYEGLESNGVVIFTLAEAKEGDTVIPEGTELVSDGLEFETLSECIIEAGDLTGETTAESVDIGAEYNIEAHTISLVDENVDYTVDNPYKFVDGVDYEEDEDFRQRILEQMQVTNFGSIPYYINKLMQEYEGSMHDVVFRSCDCDYTNVVVPNTYLGSDAQSTLNADVQAYLDDSNNIVTGQSFAVNSPTAQDLTVYVGSSASSGDNKYKLRDGSGNPVASGYRSMVKNIIEAYVHGGSVDGVGAPLEFTGLNIEDDFDCTYICSVIEEVVGSPVYIETYSGTVQSSIALGSNKDKFNLTVETS